MEKEKKPMEESVKEFDSIYADFGKESQNENLEETTVSAEEFHREWLRILKETYDGLKDAGKGEN